MRSVLATLSVMEWNELRLIVVNGDSVSVHGVILVVRCPSLLPSEVLYSGESSKEIKDHFIGDSERSSLFFSCWLWSIVIIVGMFVLGTLACSRRRNCKEAQNSS